MGRKIDVNRATEAELQALPGIGPSFARRIVREREERGAFQSLEELSRVRGLGVGRIRSLEGWAGAGR